MRFLRLFTPLLVLLLAPGLGACTTAIVSGKATKDGRPLLWKNRDADDIHNQAVYCVDGRYPYVGLVNRGDRAGLQIWSGVNASGFAIMNNASYNLDADGDKTTQEGAFMKLALQACATVEDFQSLLELSNPGGRGVSANFGVIDAKGGAAYFETDAKGFRRFDAASAPGGFLVRGNYSHSGKAGGGTGYLREGRARELVDRLRAEGRLSADTLLAEVARDTANPPIGSFPSEARKGFAYIGDSVSRDITSHAFLVQGPRPGEAPGRSTAWVILGLPVTGAAVPLWVEAASIPPELAACKSLAPLNAEFDRVRRHIFPHRETDRKRYMDAGRAYDPATGLLPPLLALEKENLAEVQRGLQSPRPDLKVLQESIAKRTLERVKEILESRGVPSAE
jgi:hypothetical protein